MSGQESRVSALCNALHLSHYQSHILERNSNIYDLARLIKLGGNLYAPYNFSQNDFLAEVWLRMFFGPRADLIGPDEMLLHDIRGIKLYPSGCFSAYIQGEKCYADRDGKRMPQRAFVRAIER